MTYTPAVPQANQTIASTQSPIEQNFQYLNTAFQYEHNFNNVLPGIQLGSHQSASMPNLGGLPSFGTGIDGVYYVNGGDARYNNGTDYQLNVWGQVLTGTYTLPNSSAITKIVTLPSGVFGVIYFYSLQNLSVFSGSFVTGVRSGNNTVAVGNNAAIISVEAPVILIANLSTFDLNGQAWDSSTQGRTYKWVITYRLV